MAHNIPSDEIFETHLVEKIGMVIFAEKDSNIVLIKVYEDGSIVMTLESYKAQFVPADSDKRSVLITSSK